MVEVDDESLLTCDDRAILEQINNILNIDEKWYKYIEFSSGKLISWFTTSKQLHVGYDVCCYRIRILCKSVGTDSFELSDPECFIKLQKYRQ